MNVKLAFNAYGYEDEVEDHNESFILESKYDKDSEKDIAEARRAEDRSTLCTGQVHYAI